jgi:hypothetical protein
MWSSLVLSWSDLKDPQMLSATLASALIAAVVGVRTARRFRLPQLEWPSAIVGVASIVFTLTPSMVLCGSVGGGMYALLAGALPIFSNVLIGKIVVVVATVVGCVLAAWAVCLLLLAAPAIIQAVRRRGTA